MTLRDRLVWITGASSGIGVTLICPGFVKTNVGANALTADGTPKRDRAREKDIPSAQCAETIADAIEQEKAEVYVGGWEITGVYAKRFVPSLFRRMIRRYDGT